MRIRHTALAAATAAAAVVPAVLVAAPADAGTRVTSASPAASALRYPNVPCVPYLPPNTAYTAIHRTYRTDALGRPVRATAPNLTQRTSPRSACETTVGGWGPAGYQGGHLIAATLRGVSERYNLVPMQGNQVNQGLMKAIENGAKRCLRRGAVNNYRIQLTYPAGPSVVPDRIAISMTPRAANPPVPFAVNFRNANYTPAGYTRVRNQIRARFAASGC